MKYIKTCVVLDCNKQPLSNKHKGMTSVKITFFSFWKKGKSNIYILLTISGIEGVWAALKKRW